MSIATLVFCKQSFLRAVLMSHSMQFYVILHLLMFNMVLPSHRRSFHVHSTKAEHVIIALSFANMIHLFITSSLFATCQLIINFLIWFLMKRKSRSGRKISKFIQISRQQAYAVKHSIDKVLYLMAANGKKYHTHHPACQPAHELCSM